MSWADQFSRDGGIRNLCRQTVADEIFKPMKIENEWKALILDEFSMKIMASCFKTEEIFAYNIATIENLEKTTREPLSYLSAIYVLLPSLQNVRFLEPDLICSSLKYQTINLYFLSDVPDDIFEELRKYAREGMISTFKENLFHFVPYESQVFSLSDGKFFSAYFDAYKEPDLNQCVAVAKQLVSLCNILKINPRIRYRRKFIKNLIIANAVLLELQNNLDKVQSGSSKNMSNRRCELLILDRGFDCVSPVMHEFTLQAMAFDMLDIQDDIYEFPEESVYNGEVKEVSVTEAEPLWIRLRHEHIAEVGKVIDGMLRANMLLKSHPQLAQFKKLPDVCDAVKRDLAFRQKHRPLIVYRRMANECMQSYCGGINILTELEQDLAIGTTRENSKVKEAYKSILNVLSDASNGINEKLRILLLYIIFTKGVTKQEFDSIITKAKLPFSEARIITNILHFDVDIFKPGSCQAVDIESDLHNEQTYKYKESRWVPVVKRIALNCIKGKLDHDKYPYLDSKEHNPYATRRSNQLNEDKKELKSYLVIFIVGGVTYSEMRSIYEILNIYKEWDIFIGSDTILTPNKYLKKLKQLRFLISKDE